MVLGQGHLEVGRQRRPAGCAHQVGRLPAEHLAGEAGEVGNRRSRALVFAEVDLLDVLKEVGVQGRCCGRPRPGPGPAPWGRPPGPPAAGSRATPGARAARDRLPWRLPRHRPEVDEPDRLDPPGLDR